MTLLRILLLAHSYPTPRIIYLQRDPNVKPVLRIVGGVT